MRAHSHRYAQYFRLALHLCNEATAPEKLSTGTMCAYFWRSVASAPSAARRAICVDPSTVSRRLALLEQALAATLFDRGRDGIVHRHGERGDQPPGRGQLGDCHSDTDSSVGHCHRSIGHGSVETAEWRAALASSATQRSTEFSPRRCNELPANTATVCRDQF